MAFRLSWFFWRGFHALVNQAAWLTSKPYQRGGEYAGVPSQAALWRLNGWISQRYLTDYLRWRKLQVRLNKAHQ